MEKDKKYRMYENPVMEILSKSGPKLMITFHLLVISAQIFLGMKYFSMHTGIVQIVLLFLSGLLLWTLAEYLLHRYLFHFESENKILKAFHFAMHGYHHEHPNDSNRLFMPPVPALIFLSLFFLLFYLFLGMKALYFLPGFEFGYLSYSFLHYLIHTRKAPKALEPLWHHHILHHYKEPEKAFGVSSKIWDRFFGTLPD